MRVKRLEIQGFKSFKDKTVIHFDHGITGIVGPNGCGKSNIVDAFFWVMGEMSYKHMRGHGSEDLIFNGSSKYTPLGMAEATLVMETDVVDTENAPAGATAADVPLPKKTKDISVTRRVYRGGEGEYFVNGIQARLKDIHELFMDTGVGAKGYSVIEQGQIDKVVNSKPEDRRLLIEEAAGIAKYKARKKESLRKMEAAQANLSRLNDVIQEIERSLGSLERQAQKARKYKEYKDELFGKEISWGRRKAQVLTAQVESVKKERETLEQELLALKTEVQIAENAIEVDRTGHVSDSKAAEELQESIQRRSNELTTERSALELSRQRQEDLKAQLAALEAEGLQLDESIRTDRAQLGEKETAAKLVDQELDQAAAVSAEKDRYSRQLRTDAEDARARLDALKRDLFDGVSQASDLTSRSAALLARAESSQAQIQRWLEQETESERGLAALREEGVGLHQNLDVAQLKRSALKDDRASQQLSVQEMEKALRESEIAQRASHRGLAQLQSRLQSLQELAAAHEGLADGPKAVLDWARAEGKTGGFQAVSDLFQVERGYENALEGWLESRLQDLVASDASEALSALQVLRAEKHGRATIHLAASPAESARAQLKVFDEIKAVLETRGFDVISPMDRLVHSAPGAQVPASIQEGMQGVCVVRSLTPAVELIRSGSLGELAGWSLVSLDGVALHAAGEIRGGSTESDSSASILGRKRAIQELQEQTDSARTEFEESEKRASALRLDLEAAVSRLELLRAEIEQADNEAMELQRDLQVAERGARDMETRLEASRRDRSEQEGELTQVQRERGEIQGRLQEFISRRSEVEERIRTAEAEYGQKDEAARRQDTDLQTYKIHEASLRERAQSQYRELEATRSFVADREKRLDEVRRLLDRVSRERDSHTGGDHGIERKIEELVKSLSDAQVLLAEIKDRLEQNSARTGANLARIKDLHRQSEEQSGRTQQLAIDTERLSGELAHLKQNLEEKYGPSCFDLPVASPIQEEMSAPVVTAEMTAEEERVLAEEVEMLRERIRRLGEVNTMAIEEYEELRKRYDHLVGEKQDLEHSIQNLQDAIEHINKTSEERFSKAFQAIANRFERLFPIVFGGGKAELSLVYPEGTSDILEAGVDILAQPPGKKIVNIGLLSGGEKALTAISLVFAIFMVKPSPFCVLDEVDAPLDDSNIGKFNALLREMAAKSQFIVITHNKKTMELNDTLYGVTMEEPGVSKMVSIELR